MEAVDIFEEFKPLIYWREKGNDSLYEMEWFTDGETRYHVCMEGDWKGRHFVILVHHTGNPNAYIEVTDEDMEGIGTRDPEALCGELCFVNCGSTYAGKAYWNKADDRMYIGWDYGHAQDYNARQPSWGGHKWNYAEILMEIAAAATELDMKKCQW